MEFREILRQRKMVRTYDRTRPVPPDVVDRVLSVVVHAPSAGYSQGNEFLVLDDPEAVDTFFRLTDDPDDPAYTEIETLPPVVVLPLANKRAYLDRYAEPDKEPFGLGDETRWPVPYWDVDAGMASMLVLCAAIEEGLGAWFSGIFANERAMLDRFGVPASFRAIGFIGMGYAAPRDPGSSGSSSHSRRRRPAGELVHRNRW